MPGRRADDCQLVTDGRQLPLGRGEHGTGHLDLSIGLDGHHVGHGLGGRLGRFGGQLDLDGPIGSSPGGQLASGGSTLDGADVNVHPGSGGSDGQPFGRCHGVHASNVGRLPGVP